MPARRFVIGLLTGTSLCVGLCIGTPTAVQGLQPTRTTVKNQEKKNEANKKEAVSGGMVEIYQARDGWRFRIKNAEGKSLAIGVVAYSSKDEALQAVQQVHQILNQQKVVTVDANK